MFTFIKRRRAKDALDLALAVLLLGRDDFTALLKKKYTPIWDGLIMDVVNGANVYVTALGVVEVLIIDTIKNDINEEQANRIVDAIIDDSFENRPAVFDVIAQAAYFSLVMEKDDTATKGIAAGFLNDIAKCFSEEKEGRNKVFEYLLQSTVRFGEKVQKERSEGWPNPK